MALIPCPECKKQISDTVDSCPKCGYKLSPEIIAGIKKKQGETAKNCGMGCLGIILLFVILNFVGGNSRSSDRSASRSHSPSNGVQREWFVGGTLHTATVGQWKRATRANKLATAADWLASTKWKVFLKTSGDFDRMKGQSERLVDAVDEVVNQQGTDSLKVNEMAAAIITMSNDLGP